MLRFRTGVFFFVFAAVILLFALPAEAKTWPVHPRMTLGEIQQVFDRAKDGDRILFVKGVYDFSNGPYANNTSNVGAIVIQDKSLTVSGVNGTLIKGKPSDRVNGQGETGITAFRVINFDRTKDVTFENLTIETFLNAIAASYITTAPFCAPNLRSLTVRDCTLRDIDRNGIVVNHAGGNVTIVNNYIEALRFGIYLYWLYAPGYQTYQPDGTFDDISGNVLRVGRAGILLTKASNVRIVDNSIEGIFPLCCIPGPKSEQGIWFEDLKGEAQIANNRIHHFWVGISLIASWIDVSPNPAIPEEFHGSLVSNNSISDISRWGISLSGGQLHDNIIENNTVDMNPGSYAALDTDSYANRFLNNTLTGSGAAAVMLDLFDNRWANGCIDAAHGEYFEGNSIAGFTADGVHYDSISYLGVVPHDNILKGICTESGTYFDCGYNNAFYCLWPLDTSSSASVANRMSVQSARMKTRLPLEM